MITRIDQRTFRNELATAAAQHTNVETEFQRAGRLIAEISIARNIFDQRWTLRVPQGASFDIFVNSTSRTDKIVRCNFLCWFPTKPTISPNYAEILAWRLPPPPMILDCSLRNGTATSWSFATAA